MLQGYTTLCARFFYIFLLHHCILDIKQQHLRNEALLAHSITNEPFVPMNLPNVSLKVLDTGFDTRLDVALSVNPFVVLQQDSRPGIALNT